LVITRIVVFLKGELVSKGNSGRKIELNGDRESQNGIEPELEQEQDIQDKIYSNTAQET